DIERLVWNRVQIIGFIEADRIFEIKGTESECDIGDGFVFEPLGNQVVPRCIVLNGIDTAGTPGQEKSGAAGAIFANGHCGLEKLVQEIDGGVGKPGDFQIERCFAVQQIVVNATRDVLR